MLFPSYSSFMLSCANIRIIFGVHKFVDHKLVYQVKF